MKYFSKRLGELGSEYKGKDKLQLLKEAGKCGICNRRPGDDFLFGPTHYLKKKIRFTVTLQVHIVDGATVGNPRVVLCSGCHMSYHLFYRLNEDASMGSHKLSETVYVRCRRCRDLVSEAGHCRCCRKCNRSPNWCRCKSKKRKRGKKKCRRSARRR